MENISGLCMQSGIDAVKIDSRVLKSRARADRSAQHRRTRDDIGKLPARPHDLVGIGDPFKINATLHASVRVFGGNHEWFVARPKTRFDDQRAIAADVGVNEIARKTLRLSLRTDKDSDAENNPAEAQKQGALAMRQKPQRNIKWRRHGAFGGGGELTMRWRTGWPE